MFETLSSRLAQVTEAFEADAQLLELQENISKANTVLRDFQEAPDDLRSNSQEELDALHDTLSRIDSEDAKFIEVRQTLSRVRSDLSGLRSQIESGIAQAGSLSIFGLTIKKLLSNFEYVRNKIAFSAGSTLEKLEDSTVAQQSMWVRFLSFLVSKERKALASALKGKKFEGIHSNNGGSIDGLIGIFKEKVVLSPDADEDKALERFFLQTARKAREMFSSATSISYAQLEQAANALDFTPAPEPQPEPQPQPVTTDTDPTDQSNSTST